MINKFLLFPLLICALILPGCIGKSSVQNSGEGKQEPYFAIYLLKGPITSETASDALTNLQLEAAPYLTDRDIASYNWENHNLILKKNRPFTQAKIGSRFVVVAEGQRIFTGEILSPAISSTRSTPVILVFETELKILLGYPDDTYGKTTGDPRKDPRIYEALTKAKVLEGRKL